MKESLAYRANHSMIGPIDWLLSILLLIPRRRDTDFLVGADPFFP